jgi:rsbT antagonist protein RsbS
MESNVPRIPLQVSRGCVIASIQIDLTGEVLAQFRKDLLSQVRDIGARGVVLDVSGIEVMDIEDFDGLRKTMEMARVMGTRTVLSGLRAGVVAALIDLGAVVDGVDAAMNLDDALSLVGAGPEHPDDHDAS